MKDWNREGIFYEVVPNRPICLCLALLLNSPFQNLQNFRQIEFNKTNHSIPNLVHLGQDVPSSGWVFYIELTNGKSGWIYQTTQEGCNRERNLALAAQKTKPELYKIIGECMYFAPPEPEVAMAVNL